MLTREIFNSTLDPFNDVLMSHLTLPVGQISIVNNYIRSDHHRRVVSCCVQAELVIEFTVSWDEFYLVPVIHFRATEVDLLKAVVTLDLHPLTGEPWYSVHPCETQKGMEAFAKSNPIDYLVTWFNVYGGGLLLLQIRRPSE